MTDGERGIAAIMFTDIEGYSALTSRDEALALELLKFHWDLLRPVFAIHKGHEIKTIGDGILIEFPSSLQAVRAGMAMQAALREYNAKAPKERQILIRIGIHVGDIERINGDVFGDGVNVTSRIEPLSPPGGIALSEPVYQQVRNKVGIPFYSIGPQRLKNIGHPMEVYTTDRTQRTRKALNSLPGATIAGLPIANTLIQVLRNPARTALAMRDGAAGLIGPWPLVLGLISASALIQQIMPLPFNSMGDVVQLEHIPGIHQVFQNEAVDLGKLRSNLARLDSFLEPVVILVVAAFAAAGLRVLDGTRRFSEYMDTFVYTTCAAYICLIALQPLFYLFFREGKVFYYFNGFINIAYFLYAIWWLYWDRKVLAIGQSTMLLLANILGSFIAVPLYVAAAFIFVKYEYGAYIGKFGNTDVYIADVAVTNRAVSVLRPSNVTKSIALHENASFSQDGKRLFVSVTADDKGAKLFAWDLRTGASEKLTNSPGGKEAEAVELADGSLLVISNRTLWRYPKTGEAERMLPDGEDVRSVCIGPSGTAMLVSGDEHRGLLLDLDSRKIRLLPGATKLGRQVQWHADRRRFTAIRTIEDKAEIITIDPGTGEIQSLIKLPKFQYDGYHAWVAPEIAIWAHDSVISAVGLDGVSWPVVDFEKQGIWNISHVVIDPARSRIAFERARTETKDQYMRALDPERVKAADRSVAERKKANP